MKGIQYIIDSNGKKRAAVVNLDVYGHLWEDIHDILVVESRKNEPRAKWEEVKKRLRKRMN
jgi:hypothetical protein